MRELAVRPLARIHTGKGEGTRARHKATTLHIHTNVHAASLLHTKTHQAIRSGRGSSMAADNGDEQCRDGLDWFTPIMGLLVDPNIDACDEQGRGGLDRFTPVVRLVCQPEFMCR